MVKGVILAGGQGTRLRPFTHVINKHLLPVYDRPLIYYPLLTMRDAGITEVLLTSDEAALPNFRTLLGDGTELGLRIAYAAQENPKGIADALGLAERFAENSKIAVMLGDNIFTDHEQIRRGIAEFEEGAGARFFLKEVPDPERFGVAYLSASKIVAIIEKPKEPPSRLAVTGLYLYDPDVFAIVKTLQLSARGELEITDVNNHYVKRGLAKYEIVEGEWIDAGTFDSLTHASALMRAVSAERERRRKQGETGLRRLVSFVFKTGSWLFRGNRFSRLPAMRYARKKLLAYLKRSVPPSVVVDGQMFFLDEHDRLELSTRGPFEPYTTTLLKRLVRPGDVVLDIGAHIGYRALILARLVGDGGRVVACEPDPANFALLEKNISVNQYVNIVAVKKDVSAPSGHVPGETVTVDDFVRDHLNGRVDLVHCSMDSRKRPVLFGMRSTLKQDSLALLTDYHPAHLRQLGYDPDEGFALLRSNGFDIYCLQSHKNEMIKITDIRQMIGNNLLCIKGERKALLERHGIL